jgi:TfoX/Sxy family transcriptional regulator of competence genes
MAYHEILTNRVRKILSTIRKIEEKKMMGGLTFMVNDKMCVGILKDDLMARINPDIYKKVLERRGCREMDFTSRPMRGFVFIDPEETKTKKNLDYWLELALA